MKVRYIQRSELKRDAALIAIAAVPLSWGVSRALVAAGVASMAGRWVLTILAVYGAYLGLLWLWSAGRSSGAAELRVIEDTPGRRGRSRSESSWLDWLDFPDIFDLDGLLFLFAAVAVLWLLSGSTIVLAEIGIEWAASCALAACLVRRTNEPWIWAIVRRTWLPAALSVAAAILAGTIIQQAYPDAATLREAIRQSRLR